MSYKTRMIPANLDPDAIIRDLCVEGAVWELGAQNNPRILKRTDLIPIAKCWHEFIIHNILPTKNQSEITLDRAVLIHCIMQGQEVQVEKLIVDSMMKVPYVASSPIEVVTKAKVITTTVPQPQIHMEHPAGNMPQGYGWGQLQEDWLTS
ncbi:hypothetical protein PIB30_113407 [Stylosanthes scabra]|uniref:Putative plant transposon protein domain-containing protein n=1 Tax=Stylosanthes scabra TaxID=79078 RepID=A0ABU6T131_9FABA|nr:hypothetical protein [Stylosanthes scabra]